MSKSSFLLSFLCYDDLLPTNSPQKKLLDYVLSLQPTINAASSLRVKFDTGDHVINVPDAPYNWFILVADQTLKIKFNNGSETVVDVSPSVAGTMDGIFVKRGSFTQLTVNVPGADDANVLLFIGV